VQNAISRSSIAPAPRDAAFPCRFHDCCCAEQGWCKSDCCCFADARATSTYERVIDAIAATSRALERSRASIDHPLVRGAKASREPCRRRVRALGACAPAGASVILERAPSIDDARADDRTRSSCAPSFARESPRVEPATPPPRALS
jgi:hypothetical protein